MVYGTSPIITLSDKEAGYLLTLGMVKFCDMPEFHEHGGCLHVVGSLTAEQIAMSLAGFRRSHVEEGEPCNYCSAIGACPRCWGRDAIDRLYGIIRTLVKHGQPYSLDDRQAYKDAVAECTFITGANRER